MSEKYCTRCKTAPRKIGRCMCTECYRDYQREWARVNRNQQPRPQPPRPLEAHEKYCAKCDRILPRDAFHKSRSKGDGLMSCCKSCDTLKQFSYRVRNRPVVREKGRLASRKFRAANPGYNTLAQRRSRRRKLEQKLNVFSPEKGHYRK